MKKQFLFLFLLFGTIATRGQNPFEKLGYIPKIATYSQGEFNEFHDQDSIVQIGTVWFNTHSQQVVGFVQADTSYSEATLQADVVSRWMSPDPLNAKFPSESPYQFVSNNPVWFVDIEGMYKWPKNKAEEYSKKYPMLTLYLSKYVENDVMSSPIIMDAMLLYSGGNLTPEKIQETVKWDSGPDIAFRSDLIVLEGGEGFYGEYKNADLDNNKQKTIRISESFAQEVEGILAGEATEVEKLTFLFEFFGTLTHETVHYGDYLDGERQSESDPSGFGAEPGAKFQSQVFESKFIKDEGKIKAIPMGDIHGNTPNLIEIQKEQGREEVLPTIPKK